MSIESADISSKKIALAHDWLLNIGGAEKTLKALHEIFPQAPIFVLFYNKEFVKKFLPNAKIIPTFLQKPFDFFKSPKLLLPFCPAAIESLNLGEFDLVISSSVAFSKGLILKPKTRHICYCYSPTRQIWDWHNEYRKGAGFSIWHSLFCHFLRLWDFPASARVDRFVAISENIRRRIEKYYGRDSTVIYPPVETPYLGAKLPRGLSTKNDYFLIVSRLFKHKNIDLAIHAFNKMGWPLVVIGEGPELKKLRKLAKPNVKLLGYQPDELVADCYSKCSAFIMPQEEDFGITPLEAMSYGKPVLALRRGGALEYIEEGINGEFFDNPTEEILADGLRRIREGINVGKYNLLKIKETAGRFSKERFKKDFYSFLCRSDQSG